MGEREGVEEVEVGSEAMNGWNVGNVGFHTEASGQIPSIDVFL